MSADQDAAPFQPDCPPQVRPAHRQKPAIVYARQSTNEQLREHTGSTAAQIALADLPRRWGWPEDRIVIIDDFGLSGTSPDRPGFEKMLDLLDRGEVSLILARAVDRISRDPADAAMFLKKALKAKVLLHVDGRLYDTTTASDNVIELFMLHFQTLWGWLDNMKRVQIFQSCKASKVRQGKAVTRPPIGYVRASKGEWVKDPDPRVREAVRRVFDLYLELRSLKKVVRFMLQHRLEFPRRCRGQLRWEVGIARSQLAAILHNPLYTGDYIFRRTDKS
jgi:DNA invertase Pin-like site-specific DNA recombinase